MAAESALTFTRVSPERHVEASAERAGSLSEALAAISTEFALGRFASKERVDLAALAAAGLPAGGSAPYAQPELIPDDVFAAARARHAVAAHVLAPGPQALVALYDAHGPIKGLPPNERATRLATACGAPARGLRGTVFVVRLAAPPGGAGGAGDGADVAAHGADFLPTELAARETLEAAQAANAAAASPRAAADRAALEAAVHAAVARALRAPAPRASAPASAESPAPPPAERLRWADGGAEVVVTVAVPARTTRADVAVALKPESLCVRVRTLPAGEEAVVDGRLFQRIDVDDSNWALESAAAGAPTRALVVTLAKEKQMRWLQLTRRE